MDSCILHLLRISSCNCILTARFYHAFSQITLRYAKQILFRWKWMNFPCLIAPLIGNDFETFSIVAILIWLCRLLFWLLKGTTEEKPWRAFFKRSYWSSFLSFGFLSTGLLMRCLLSSPAIAALRAPSAVLASTVIGPNPTGEFMSVSPWELGTSSVE